MERGAINHPRYQLPLFSRLGGDHLCATVGVLSIGIVASHFIDSTGKEKDTVPLAGKHDFAGSILAGRFSDQYGWHFSRTA